jgi:hypothetical protein
MRSGHMTTPSIGFWDAQRQKAFWLVTDQGNPLGDHGIAIEENRPRTEARISITSPVVREVYRYRFLNNQYPSSDVAATFREGDEVAIRFRLDLSPAPRLQDLFDRFTALRKIFVEHETHTLTYPFSNAFGILERKYNRDNWNEEIGEVTFMSTWPEASLALTFSEIPGVYANAATGVLEVFDNIEASWEEPGKTLRLHNPTPYEARVKILIDSELAWQSQSIDRWMLESPPVVTLKSGETAVHDLSKIK